MGLPIARSSLDVHLDSDSHHHVPDSGVVLQDETRDIRQSTAAGVSMHNRRNEVISNRYGVHPASHSTLPRVGGSCKGCSSVNIRVGNRWVCSERRGTPTLLGTILRHNGWKVQF